jgi:hypothetical protein
MIETEFDRRLRDYLDEGPGAPEGRLLEVVVGHARSHPQRRALRVRWNDATSGWFTWPPAGRAFRLALLAAVLAALAFTGGLYVGSRVPPPVVPSPTATPFVNPTPLPALAPLAICPAGSTPDLPGPVDQERPNVSVEGSVAFDRQSGRLVTTTAWPDNGIWSFDVCSNTWHRSSVTEPRSQEPMLERVSLGYDPLGDRTVLFTNPILAFDVDRDTLATRGREPLLGQGRDVVYRSATRTLVARVGSEQWSQLWAYEPVADAWQQLLQLGDRPPLALGAALLAYDASVDRLVLYTARGDDRRTYEFDFATSTWARQAIQTPVVELVWGDLGSTMVTYDDASARTVVMGIGQVIAYDAASHAWDVVYEEPRPPDDARPDDPSHRTGVILAYDPLNRRILAIGGNRWGVDGPIAADDVVAFDLATREWFELLAPTTP